MRRKRRSLGEVKLFGRLEGEEDGHRVELLLRGRLVIEAHLGAPAAEHGQHFGAEVDDARHRIGRQRQRLEARQLRHGAHRLDVGHAVAAGVQPHQAVEFRQSVQPPQLVRRHVQILRRRSKEIVGIVS